MNSEEFWEKRRKDIIQRFRGLKRIDARKISLDEWLALLNPDDKEKYLFIHWSFPTNTMRNEYLETIHTRTDKEVIDLIRNFLIPSGSLVADEWAIEYLMNLLEQDKGRFDELTEMEYYRRLLRGYFTGEAIWEGNTWVIDLLPDRPKLALDVLHAYLVAHFQFLPDGRIDGLLHAMTLIRAKFIETPKSSFLLSLNPYQFELLIKALYEMMGYTTTLTQSTYDKGRDVIAEKKHAGEREKLLIQCRRTERNVGVKEVRNLLGVIFNEKANKGVFVSTSEFTPKAKEFANENPLELIDNKDLQLLLNKYFGSKWPKHVDFIISRSLPKRKTNTSTTGILES